MYKLISDSRHTLRRMLVTSWWMDGRLDVGARAIIDGWGGGSFTLVTTMWYDLSVLDAAVAPFTSAAAAVCCLLVRLPVRLRRVRLNDQGENDTRPQAR